MGQYDRKAQSARKHGPILSSSTSKAPSRPPPIAKPEWRGSGYTKKAKPKPHLDAAKPVPLPQDQILPVELQQLMLNIFKDAFVELSADFEDIKDMLRAINEAVLERDWDVALGEESKREAYAVRWSPSRALAYANVLAQVCEQRAEDGGWVSRITDSLLHKPTKAVCFGGGAAEVMAFAGLLRHLRPETAGKPQAELDEASSTEEPVQTPLLDLALIDSADWSGVTQKMLKATTTPPPLSKYASASAIASNTALLAPSSINISFSQHDIFSLTTTQLQNILDTETPILVTLFLTLTDLYSSNIPKTTAFLRKLDSLLPLHSTILIIDSISASVSVPSTQDTAEEEEAEEVTEYTTEWLISRVLLGKPLEKVPLQGRGKKVVEAEELQKPIQRWERIVYEEMKVNRLEDKLRYPGSLENVRFQVLAFRRV